ncbi:IucA/IucC family protein [Halomonas sp. SCS19]|uniref:IucA/IucC family protein n=1 Tax=Halomonas sp. SCS19 TaxID=2950870 RepID=UPI0032DEBC27
MSSPSYVAEPATGSADAVADVAAPRVAPCVAPSAVPAAVPFASSDDWRHRPRIERRVIGQLLQTLLYEDVLEYRCEHLAPPEGEGQGRETTFVVSLGERDYRVRGWLCHSFSLIRLDHQSLAVASTQALARAPARASTKAPALAGRDGRTQSPSLSEFLDDLASTLSARAEGDLQGRLQPGFINELKQTLIKDLQSSTAAPVDGQSAPHTLDADALEQYFTDAHSYHPCYKSRLGFTLGDNCRFGPEFGQPLRVLWLALPARLAHQGAVPGLGALATFAAMADAELGDEGSPARQRLAEWLGERGLAREQAVLLPVHPWQWENVLVGALYPELASGEIVLLGEGETRYRPQQSIRTLAPLDHDRRASPTPYLKLALGITNTSSTRILARHTITNGPIITAWLKQLLESDAGAGAANVVILGEVAGVALDERAFGGLRHDEVYGQAGALWREHIDGFLAPGEQAVPFNGLSQCLRDPDGAPTEPFIADWIARHGRDAWTRQLVSVATLPIIHLLFAEGVGLESHGQNIVVIHRDGWPVRVALKDFHDGVRYCPSALARPELAPSLEPLPAAHAARNRNSFIVTDDLAAVRDYSCDAFFFIALAEMAIFLERHFGLTEGSFWAMVADVITAYQDAHPEHAERYRQFDVFVPEWEVEALTRRRLFGDEMPQIKRVPNPLALHAPVQRPASVTTGKAAAIQERTPC